MNGYYSFQIDHREYVSHKDGRPLTLVECLEATYGCANATVWSPTHRPACRLPVREAGSVSARHAATRRRR